MILPYIVEIAEALKKRIGAGEFEPAEDQFSPAEIQPNGNVLIPPEENSFEMSYLEFKEQIEKERFERELLVRNK